MKLYLILTMFLCIPFGNYAAFPVKRDVFDTIKRNTADKVYYKHKHPYQQDGIKYYSKARAIELAILSLLLLGMGLHRFYLGYKTEGTTQVIAFASGVLGISLAIIGLSSYLFAGLLLVLLGGLLFIPTMISWLWQLIDLVCICAGWLRPKNGKYIRSKKHNRENVID